MNMDVCVTDYGVKPDGTLQTAGIQQAIDDCFAHGGGTVRIPSGEFFTGGLRLRSNITLYLCRGAVLKGSRDITEYSSVLSDKVEPINDSDRTEVLWSYARPERDNSYLLKPVSSWNNALIRAIDAENVSVIGEDGSVIDGCDPYDETGEEHYRGPHGIDMHRCRNVTLKGYTLMNTGNWAHAIYFSSGITISGVTVLAGHDGAHFSSCDDIFIENSKLATGDDCIAGFDNNNVTVINCELNSACSAFRFGGNKVRVEDCHIYGPAEHLFRGGLSVEEKKQGVHASTAGGRYNMLSVFTYYADYTLKIRKEPGDILFKNCRVENTTRFIHYNFSGNEPWQLARPLSSVRFKNVSVDGVTMPIHLYGDESSRISVTLDGVHYKMTEGNDCRELFKIAHIEKLSVRNVTVENFRGDTVFASWGDVREISLDNFNLGDDAEALTVSRSDKFECTPI